MPAKPAAQEPERTPAASRTTDATPEPAAKEEPAKTSAAEEPAADEVPEGRLPAGVYEFVGTIPTQYFEVPLTAHPEIPGQDSTDDTEAVPAVAATVFDWPFSAPGDGRWKPSKKKPNQQPDNAPADDPEGE